MAKRKKDCVSVWKACEKLLMMLAEKPRGRVIRSLNDWMNDGYDVVAVADHPGQGDLLNEIEKQSKLL